MSWTFEQSVNPDGFGFFAINMWNKGEVTLTEVNPLKIADVTFFRDVPTQIEMMEFSDPFGDATASLRFPQCTGFDSADPEGDTWWLKEYTNVDILWIPCSTTPIGTGEKTVYHPLTQQRSLYAHESLAQPIWEGFTVSVEPSTEGVSVQCLGALRQLDNYYAKPLNPLRPKFVETYIRRYMDPRRRGIWTLPLKTVWPENWNIKYTKDKKKKFEKLGARYVPTEKVLDPLTGQPANWSGYITRISGSWQPILTGFINEQLSIMYAKPAAADTDNPLLSKGDQWTITNTPGRQPVMRVRRSDVDPTLVAWYGQPGVEARLTRDGTQAYNVVFGKGAGPSGESIFDGRWYPTGPWNTYKPLYAKENTWVGDQSGPMYPDGAFPIRDLYDGYDANNERNNGIVVREKYVANFPDGVTQGDAQVIAENWVEKDSDPGWTGEITLQVDLRDFAGNPRSKWTIRDGDVIVLYGFQGTGETVVKNVNKFHVTRVQLNPMNGSVSLSVDTKFRDQLSVEEAMKRGKDTLSAVRSLIVNRATNRIEDSIVPWNYQLGSGRVPKASNSFDNTDYVFPYLGDAGDPDDVTLIGTRTTGYRPRDIFKSSWRPGGNGKPVANDDEKNDPQSNTVWLRTTLNDNKDALYVPIQAAHTNRSRRWGIVPVLLSQAGTIALTEFCAYDQDGEVAPIEFHVSFYQNNSMFINNMPYEDDSQDRKNAEHAALWPNAFENVNPDTNLPWPPPSTGVANNHTAPASFKMGWGTYERPAGYSPGMKLSGTSDARTPTGYLMDGAPWTFNFVGQNGGDGITASGLQANGEPPTNAAVTGTVAIYAQIPNFNTVVNGVEMTPDQMRVKYQWVYFMGRFYRDVPTT